MDEAYRVWTSAAASTKDVRNSVVVLFNNLSTYQIIGLCVATAMSTRNYNQGTDYIFGHHRIVTAGIRITDAS